MNTDQRLLRGPTDSETLVIASKLAATYRTAGEWPSVAQEAWQLLRGYCRQGQGSSAALPHGMGDRLARLLVGRECARSFTEEECVVVNELIVWALKLPHAPDAPTDSAGHAWSDADVRECAARMCNALYPSESLDTHRAWAAKWDDRAEFMKNARIALDIAASRLSAQWDAPSSAPLRDATNASKRFVSKHFMNEVGSKIVIDVALGDPGGFCRFEIIGPDSVVESYTTRMELEQLRDALNYVLPTAPPIPDALREKAREIAPKLQGGAPWSGSEIERALALVRELAAQP